MKTGVVNIHGRDYETVASRVAKFWAKNPEFSLTTELVSMDSEVVVFKAAIRDEHGVIRATGHAEEKRNASQINRTSALENCETSAIGRALAALGIGGQEFASAEEVQNAIQQQDDTMTDTQRDQLDQLIAAGHGKEIWVDENGKVTDPGMGKNLHYDLLVPTRENGGKRERVQALLEGAVRLINDHKRKHPPKQTKLSGDWKQPSEVI